jgi:hypothetical protein
MTLMRSVTIMNTIYSTESRYIFFLSVTKTDIFTMNNIWLLTQHFLLVITHGYDTRGADKSLAL